MNAQIFEVGSYKMAAHYSEGGNDLVFFIHGLGCSRDSFQQIYNFPVLQKYSLLCPDLLGFGMSDKPLDFSYTMSDHAKICELLLDQFTFERLHIVAHSMGGAIGLLLSSRLLDSVTSFINVEGNLIAEDCGVASRRAASVSFETFRDEILPEFKVKFKDYAHFDLASPEAIYKSAQSLVQVSDSNALIEIFLSLRCHKAYVFGEENREHATRIATSSIQQIEIAHSGHFSMVDNPKEFYLTLEKLIG